MKAKELIDNAVRKLATAGISPWGLGGKIHYDTDNTPGGNWVYIRYMSKNCTYLRTVLHDLIITQLPVKDRFVPSECQDCYKVVVRPESYKDLLKLKGIMETLDLPGKCGIESRDTVDALYGGYFYCSGLKEGLHRLNAVEVALLGTGMTPFLKRGCTEYETEYGPSDKWTISDAQKKLEADISKRLSVDNLKKPQTLADINTIMDEWQKFAEALGPDYKPTHNYVTYKEQNNVQVRKTG